MVASLRVIRLIGNEYPQCVRLQFGELEYQQLKSEFDAWYAAAKGNIPKKYRESVLKEAALEFDLFEKDFLSKGVGAESFKP